MAFQLAPPSATPYAPQTPQSQYLAQALASMNAQQPRTPVAAGANAMAGMLNRINDPSNPPQWTGVDGQPSRNWFDSAVGSQVGGLFRLGKAAQTQQGLDAASQVLGSGGVMPVAF